MIDLIRHLIISYYRVVTSGRHLKHGQKEFYQWLDQLLLVAIGC